MISPQNNSGIMHLALQSVFAYIQSASHYEFFIKCSFYEVHRDLINDLLKTSNSDLEINEKKPGKSQKAIKINGLTEENCFSYSQAAALLNFGYFNHLYGKDQIGKKSSTHLV